MNADVVVPQRNTGISMTTQVPKKDDRSSIKAQPEINGALPLQLFRVVLEGEEKG
jgi:hypothetical protein